METDQRPKTRYAYLGHEERFDSVEIGNGQVQGVRLYTGEWVKPQAFFSQTEYSRASGKTKVVNRVLNSFAVDPAAYLTECGAFYAIDTNTRQIGENRVSVGCILECFAHFTSERQVTVDFPRWIITPFKNCEPGLEERHTWAVLVRLITASPVYKVGQRVAIVTDHDLNNHARFQRKDLPLEGDTYLPEGFELIYASTDTGGHEINRLVMECDKRSSQVLRQLGETGTAPTEGATIEIGALPDLRAK